MGTCNTERSREPSNHTSFLLRNSFPFSPPFTCDYKLTTHIDAASSNEDKFFNNIPKFLTIN